jgi:hypothetical protein
MRSRLDAQRRADRIRAFREELDELRAEGSNPLSPEQEFQLAAHHDIVLAELAREFDVDQSSSAWHLSRGLRAASLFGAAALVASVALLVTRWWGGLSMPAQVTLLALFPLAALGGVEVAARREKTLYVAALFALAACGTAWVAVWMLPRILDLPFSALLLWPGVLFGAAVALSYGFRAVLAVTLSAFVFALAAAFFASGGVPWTAAFERLEPIALPAFAIAIAAPRFAEAGEGFDGVARGTGLVIGLGALLMLASIAGTSLLPFAPSTSRHVYQAMMLLVTLACVAYGIARQESRTFTIAAVFLALFLLVRYVDWFWDLVPGWAFFLVLAGVAFASIALLRRLRTRLEA